MNRMLVAGTLAVAVALLAGTKGNGENLLQRLREQGVGTTPKPLDPIEFELQDLEGKSIKLSSLKGKVVFLNFWATWCGPCRTEMPSMQRLYERFKDQGLEILAVDLQEDKATVQSFVKELGLTFKVLLDTKGTVGAQYAARAIPTTYLLDRKGFVFARMVGSREWDTPEMMELIRRILKDGVTYEEASSP